ncbi:MAG: ATP-binding cassette domain-containing protein, partial [Pseudomonadota bacterium]
CEQCLWLEPPTATLFPGGFSKAREQRELDRTTAVRERDKAKREQEHLHREAAKRREQASRSHRDRSKRGLDLKDNDSRFRKNLARVTGKDGQAGRLLRQLDGRGEQAKEKLAAAHVDKVYDMGFWLPGSRSQRSTLLNIEAGSLLLGTNVYGSERFLHFPSLSMRPDERIAVTGPNGTGKTTLLNHILANHNVAEDKLTNMPQEVDAEMSWAILEDARKLAPKQLGHVMSVVSGLGSRPQRLLQSREPSPGELRKLLLALGVAKAPHLIMMDEPTNHLDLPSIECLEDALVDCPCGLLLVSHDQRFLGKLATIQWEIQGDGLGDSYLEIKQAQ